MTSPTVTSVGNPLSLICRINYFYTEHIDMLSIERIKEIINDPSLSDEDLTEIGDEYRLLAEILSEQWNQERKLRLRALSEGSGTTSEPNLEGCL